MKKPRVNKITEKTYCLVDGLNRASMYLLIGHEKALLIDTGNGVSEDAMIVVSPNLRDATVKAVVDQLAEKTEPHQGVALFPGFVSPADIRYLKEIIEDFDLQGTILPDISLTLDGPALKEEGAGGDFDRKDGASFFLVVPQGNVGRGVGQGQTDRGLGILRFGGQVQVGEAEISISYSVAWGRSASRMKRPTRSSVCRAFTKSARAFSKFACASAIVLCRSRPRTENFTGA